MMKTLSQYISEQYAPGASAAPAADRDKYFYAVGSPVKICRADLEDGLGVEGNFSDEDMQALTDAVADELAKYSDFVALSNGMTVDSETAFGMYFNGEFGDREYEWLEEEADTAFWKELEECAIRLGLINLN